MASRISSNNFDFEQEINEISPRYRNDILTDVDIPEPVSVWPESDREVLPPRWNGDTCR